MVITRSRFRKGAVLTAGVVASGLMLASCVSSRSSAPEEIATSRPSVTYKYNTDDELIQANNRAVTYCNGYNFIPQPTNFSNEPDGRKAVVFDCVAPTQVAISTQQYNQNSTFNYKSDQELLVLSREAQLYCMDNGNQQAFSSIQTNMDGGRSVTFRCAAQ